MAKYCLFFKERGREEERERKEREVGRGKRETRA